MLISHLTLVWDMKKNLKRKKQFQFSLLFNIYISAQNKN
jgi:hypothetical protein